MFFKYVPPGFCAGDTFRLEFGTCVVGFLKDMCHFLAACMLSFHAATNVSACWDGWRCGQPAQELLAAIAEHLDSSAVAVLAPQVCVSSAKRPCQVWLLCPTRGISKVEVQDRCPSNSSKRSGGYFVPWGDTHIRKQTQNLSSNSATFRQISPKFVKVPPI